MEEQAALQIQSAWRSHKRRAAKLEHDMIYKEDLCKICGSNELEEKSDRCSDCIRAKYNISRCTDCRTFMFTIDDLCIGCRNDDDYTDDDESEADDDDACRICGDTDKTCGNMCLTCLKENEREDSRRYGGW